MSWQTTWRNFGSIAPVNEPCSCLREGLSPRLWLRCCLSPQVDSATGPERIWCRSRNFRRPLGIRSNRVRMQLENTVIRAPVSGTILKRNVEKGEFVTAGFVGDRGAKGYVVSLADLNDLEVELDINQNDFTRPRPNQPATVTTDAYPDRKYSGLICEISPEANRQKATVQVKVRIEKPDQFLRPDMNALVQFSAKIAFSGSDPEFPKFPIFRQR